MYKPGQGVVSRLGAWIIGILLGSYAAFSWYSWLIPVEEEISLNYYLSAGFIGAVVVFLGCLLGFAYIAFKAPKSGDYLIDMDDELRKVVWPKVFPLLSSKTEAWGSTYVVIACSIIFTIFIWLIDLFLRYTISYGLFENILFAQ